MIAETYGVTHSLLISNTDIVTVSKILVRIKKRCSQISLKYQNKVKKTPIFIFGVVSFIVHLSNKVRTFPFKDKLLW